MKISSIEDLLPLLIGFVWLAFTLYNRGKKKQRSTQTASTSKQQPKGPSILEQILLGQEIKIPEKEDYEGEYEPGYFEEGEPEEESIMSDEKPAVKPFLSEELSAISREGQSLLKNPAANEMSDVEIENLDQRSRHEMLDDFNLRKAVIYSEIMNPPYINFI